MTRGSQSQGSLLCAGRRQYRPLPQRRHFSDVHRKQPLDHHGSEKARRKTLDWAEKRGELCGTWWLFPREPAQKSAPFLQAEGPGQKLRRLVGGQTDIRTRGGCLTCCLPAAHANWRFV